MAQSEIEAAKERHIRVSAGESLTNVYNRPDGVFAEFEHILIAEGMHANDCRILADAYVSQQSQPVNERLLHVLTEIRDACEAPADVFGADLAEDIREAIAAAEAEIEERRMPVTEEWLKDQPGWVKKHPTLVPAYFHAELDAQVNFWRSNGPVLLFGATQINDPQRWHVLDLMRVIGGAK